MILPFLFYHAATSFDSAYSQYKYPYPVVGVVDEDVRHRAGEPTVLNDWATAQECGQEGTTNFVISFIKFLATSSSSSVGNRFGKAFAIFNASYFEPA